MADIVSRVGEAQSEIVMLLQRQGNRVLRLKKRQETHVVTCKASILQAGDTPEKELDQLEDNIRDVCSEKIPRGDEPYAVSHHDVGADHPDTAAGGVAVHLPLLEVMPST